MPEIWTQIHVDESQIEKILLQLDDFTITEIIADFVSNSDDFVGVYIIKRIINIYNDDVDNNRVDQEYLIDALSEIQENLTTILDDAKEKHNTNN